MTDFLIFSGLFMLTGYIVLGLILGAVYVGRERERRRRVNRRRVMEGITNDQD